LATLSTIWRLVASPPQSMLFSKKTPPAFDSFATEVCLFLTFRITGGSASASLLRRPLYRITADWGPS
jgi:hypothetical protein